MKCCDFETTFLIEGIDTPKGFEDISSFLCGKVTCSSEVNIVAQCDQECYLIHEKNIHSQEYIFVEFLKYLGGSDEILSHSGGLLPSRFPFI